VMVGILVASIVGYLSIRWLLAFLTHRTFYPFALYCTVIGLLTITVFLVRK
jgi:undecaprenyl pyrophosphate phosphatase UppP